MRPSDKDGVMVIAPADVHSDLVSKQLQSKCYLEISSVTAEVEGQQSAVGAWRLLQRLRKLGHVKWSIDASAHVAGPLKKTCTLWGKRSRPTKLQYH